jgi:hypothetical protein
MLKKVFLCCAYRKGYNSDNTDLLIFKRSNLQGAGVTWNDCHQCRYSLFDGDVCEEQGHDEDIFTCDIFVHRRQFSVFDYSMYAPQIAWWLEFFPPEQIKILTSRQLKEPSQRIPVRFA